MSRIVTILLLILISLKGFSQSKLYFRCDTCFFQGTANSNLVIKGVNRDSTGFVLTNIGKGVTQFRAASAAGWSLTGNAGTSAFNFLGTTDNQPLEFRINNVRSGYVHLGSSLTFLGYNAGINNSSTSLTAIGASAGANNAGLSNTFVGALSGSGATNNYNTGLGANALTGSTGSFVTGLGRNAGVNNTRSHVILLGDQSLILRDSAASYGDSATIKYHGFGTAYPTKFMDVRGALRLVDGTQGANKLLTSDASGNASWQSSVAPDTSNLLQTASYVIEKISTTTYARPAYKSGLPAYSGTTSSTVINSAIAALTSGGTIFVRQANYTITAKVVSGSNSNINLIFEKGAKWTAGNALNDHVLDLGSVSHWRILYAEIDGNTANQTTRTVDPSCININGCADVIVDHSYLYGGHEYGVFIKNNNTFCGVQNSRLNLCDWNLITFGNNDVGCFAINNECSNAGDVGITTLSNKTKIVGNYVHDIQGSLGSNNGRWGIGIEIGFGNVIEDNLIVNTNVAISISSGADSNTVKGNLIYAWDLGNGFLGAIGVHSNYNNFFNNVLSKNFGSAAIAFDIYSNKNVFSNNRTTGTRGFVLEPNADDNIIENNTINASSAAIWVSASTDDNTIIRNNYWKGSGGDVTESGTNTIYSNNIYADGTLHTFTLSSPTTVTGVLPVPNGGLGLASYTAGDLVYASAVTTFSKLAIGSTGKKLTVVGGIPAWVDSTASIAKTGTTGDLISFSASNTPSNISAVATGSLLASAGTSTLPAWSASPTLTTSLTTPLIVGGTGTTSPLTFKTTTGVGTTNADMIFQVGSNGGTEAMRILNSGFVGIGGSPSYKLEIKGAGQTALFGSTVTDNTTSSYAGMFAASAASELDILNNAAARNTVRYGITLGGWSEITHFSGGNGLIIGTNPALPLVFGTNNTERIRILSGGNVGIGVTSPTAILHLKASTATANTASLKMDAGTRQTSGENGTINYETGKFVMQNDGLELGQGLIFKTDNTYDIGASGATRPRNGYFGGSVIAGGSITTIGDLQAGATRSIFWTTGSALTSPSDGIIFLQNNAGTSFNRLQFGGTTSSFPAIKRNGAALDIRLADDAGYAALNAGAATFNSTVTFPTPFTLGATSVTSTGTQLNYLSGATGTTGTGAVVLGTSPDFTTSATIGGVAIPTISSTNTVTNKRITPRMDTVISSTTPTINTDLVDVYKITALAGDITAWTMSGTPTDAQRLLIVIVGTASRFITWGAPFEASSISLPVTTSGTNRLDVWFIYNKPTGKWRISGTY